MLIRTSHQNGSGVGQGKSLKHEAIAVSQNIVKVLAVNKAIKI